MMFEEITADPGANLTISVISAKSDYIWLQLWPEIPVISHEVIPFIECIIMYSAFITICKFVKATTNNTIRL